MGEIIKTFGKINIGNEEVEFELNKPHAAKDLRSVHVQSKRFRFEMNEKEFLKLALTVIVAEKKLRELKEM